MPRFAKDHRSYASASKPGTYISLQIYISNVEFAIFKLLLHRLQSVALSLQLHSSGPLPHTYIRHCELHGSVRYFSRHTVYEFLSSVKIECYMVCFVDTQRPE